MIARGFTILELLICLSIMTLLLAFGVPNLSQLIKTNRLAAATSELRSAIALTRNTAISTNSRVTMRALGHWHGGWEIFLDNNHDGDRDPGESLLLQNDGLTGVRVWGSSDMSDYISFIGTGEGRQATGSDSGALLIASLYVCAEDSDEGYRLVMSRGGRVRMAKAGSAKCSITI